MKKGQRRDEAGGHPPARSIVLKVGPRLEVVVRRGYTDGGEALTKLIPEIFRLNAEFGRAQGRLTRDIGLSFARWRLLDAIAHTRPLHVASFARILQLTRQSVQKLISELKAEGYLRFADNPANRRAGLIVLTAKGLRSYRTATRRQVPWVNRLADGLHADNLAALISTVRLLMDRLTEDRRSVRILVDEHVVGDAVPGVVNAGEEQHQRRCPDAEQSLASVRESRECR